MADAPTPDNGRRLMPSFRNELSLGNLLVLAGLIAAAFQFALAYENRMTRLEVTLSQAVPTLQKEIDQLDNKVDLSRQVRGIRQGVDELIDQHRSAGPR